MMHRVLLRLPQVSANETTATLLEWTRSAGESVRKGEIVCAIETTKSVFEVEAEADGVLFPLLQGGETAEVGQAIAVLASSPKDRPESILAWLETQKAEAAPSTPAKTSSWTKKAEILARRHGIDLDRVPSNGDKITEADVQAYLDASALSTDASAVQPRDLVDGLYPTGSIERVLILGGGDGAVQVLDAMAKIPGQRCVGILDDNLELHGRSIMGVPVLGPLSISLVRKMIDEGACDAAVISISTIIPLRRQLYEEASACGIPFANVIHPTVCVGLNTALGKGNVILAFCHLGACAAVGDNNFLSAYVSIEHHGRLGSHCSFGPAVVTSSRVEIGDGTRLGTGIFIEPKLRIGAGSTIASGSILRGDVPAGSVVKTRLSQVVRYMSSTRDSQTQGSS